MRAGKKGGGVSGLGSFSKKKEAGPKTNCLYLVRFKTNIGWLPLIMKTENNFKWEKILKFTHFCNF